MRGDEWLSSVPLGVLLYQAFGWQPPIWAHLPVILNPNGQGKMKKREIHNPDGTTIPVYVKNYRADGYVQEAMFNFLANIGWSLDGSTEVFSQQQAIDAFDISGINPAPAAFPYEKLAWLNGVTIRNLDDDDLCGRLLPFVAKSMQMSEMKMAERPELRPAVPLIKAAIPVPEPPPVTAMSRSGFTLRYASAQASARFTIVSEPLFWMARVREAPAPAAAAERPAQPPIKPPTTRLIASQASKVRTFKQRLLACRECLSQMSSINGTLTQAGGK